MIARLLARCSIELFSHKKMNVKKVEFLENWRLWRKGEIAELSPNVANLYLDQNRVRLLEDIEPAIEPLDDLAENGDAGSNSAKSKPASKRAGAKPKKKAK